MSRAKYMKAARLNLLSRVGATLDPKVAASERMTMSAGAFDAWRVEAIRADGAKMTIWIEKRTYRHLASRIAGQS